MPVETPAAASLVGGPAKWAVGAFSQATPLMTAGEDGPVGCGAWSTTLVGADGAPSTAAGAPGWAAPGRMTANAGPAAPPAGDPTRLVTPDPMPAGVPAGVLAANVLTGGVLRVAPLTAGPPTLAAGAPTAGRTIATPDAPPAARLLA